MNSLRTQAGFSLVEVMCAILILGIGLAGLTHGITTALLSNKEAEIQTTAALIAAGRIEFLRADGYFIEGEDDGECGEGLSQYHWRQSITRTAIEGLHEVNVRVESSGKPVYELRTLLFDPPLASTLDEAGRRKEGSRDKR